MGDKEALTKAREAMTASEQYPLASHAEEACIATATAFALIDIAESLRVLVAKEMR